MHILLRAFCSLLAFYGIVFVFPMWHDFVHENGHGLSFLGQCPEGSASITFGSWEDGTTNNQSGTIIYTATPEYYYNSIYRHSNTAWSVADVNPITNGTNATSASNETMSNNIAMDGLEKCYSAKTFHWVMFAGPLCGLTLGYLTVCVMSFIFMVTERDWIDMSNRPSAGVRPRYSWSPVDAIRKKSGVDSQAVTTAQKEPLQTIVDCESNNHNVCEPPAPATTTLRTAIIWALKHAPLVMFRPYHTIHHRLRPLGEGSSPFRCTRCLLAFFTSFLQADLLNEFFYGWIPSRDIIWGWEIEWDAPAFWSSMTNASYETMEKVATGLWVPLFALYLYGFWRLGWYFKFVLSMKPHTSRHEGL